MTLKFPVDIKKSQSHRFDECHLTKKMDIDYCVGVMNCCGEHEFQRLASTIILTKYPTTKNRTHLFSIENHKSLFLEDKLLFIWTRQPKAKKKTKQFGKTLQVNLNNIIPHKSYTFLTLCQLICFLFSSSSKKLSTLSFFPLELDTRTENVWEVESVSELANCSKHSICLYLKREETS